MYRLLITAILLLPGMACAQEKGVSVRKSDTTLDFRVDGKTVTRYTYAREVTASDGSTKQPLAKPFFYPLLAPNGVPVTRGWPMEAAKPDETKDHVHQKSVWFCHGDVIPEGLELKVHSADKHVKGVDFWSETAGHGRIVCVEVGEPKTISPTHVMVPTRNEWRAADGLKILDEARDIHFQVLPEGYLITLEIDLNASSCPLTFGDTKEGAMGIRVNDTIREANKNGDGKLVNANGKRGEKEAWGLEADWCDYSGSVGGKTAGITVFDAKTNPYHPAWHARGYGLMAANPFGRDHSGFPSRKGQTELVKLAKGEHLKLKYGVYAHSGDATSGKVAETYQNFSK